MPYRYVKLRHRIDSAAYQRIVSAGFPGYVFTGEVSRQTLSGLPWQR